MGYPLAVSLLFQIAAFPIILGKEYNQSDPTPHPPEGAGFRAFSKAGIKINC